MSAIEKDTAARLREARTAIEQRKIYGALIVGDDNIEIMTASAASAQAAQVIGQAGPPLALRMKKGWTITDVRPFPADDPRGAGLSGGALPLALGGWIAAILEHNHELGVARAESARARIGASRADAERRPDPSIGVRMARERDGEERLLGVTLAIPLSGAGRRADADAAALVWIEMNRSPPALLAISARACKSWVRLSENCLSVLRV